MVAINSALAVDLTGQVAADTVGGQFFSGIGGQVDFVRGAARSRGGKPIIALPSTAKAGSISRIQAVLESGAGVVTSRGDVHWVVTEYGAADLWGKTVRERAAALIEVAHPDFRCELVAAAKARKYVLPDQRVPRVPPLGEEPHLTALASGASITVRPIRISDEDALQDLFYKLSADSSYQRFHAHVCAPSHQEIRSLVDIDYDRCVAVVAVAPGDSGEELVGMARYDVALATGFAEVSLVVVDAWQSRGVGTAMFRRIAEIARARGVDGFHADVLADNGRMLAIFNKSGMQIESVLEQGTYRVNMTFSGERPAA